MLVIFEGNEDSGKTTLLSAIKTVRPYFVASKRTSFKTWWDDYSSGMIKYPENWDLAESFKHDWRFFLEMLGQDGAKLTTFLCDRSFITHMIFAKALYPETWNSLMDEYYEAYEHEMLKMQHVIVYCKRDVQDFEDHFSGDRSLGQEDYDLLAEQYDIWRAKTKLNVLDIDNNNYTVEENTLKVISVVGA